ncbi:MAG: class I SAM-dependent methyltransferase [Candidatus Sumerlaeia bacterium]|nr:class I SAM-dependent methyltransferase [Candidatus Sumerlaeia bacterium]
MMERNRTARPGWKRWVSAVVLGWGLAAWIAAEPLLVPDDALHTRDAAEGMIRAASTSLAPVYAPLAEQIVRDFELADKTGIGIDLGSGPGNLIIELCKRTRLHWINADINPHFFPHFYKTAEEAGVGHRVSAVFADAQALPFRDNYADVIVSRGSFWLWEDKARAFAEIYRVLKPGGLAYIGRGFPTTLPPEVARKIREGQESSGKPTKSNTAPTSPTMQKQAKGAKGGKGMKYDVKQTEADLRAALKAAGIVDFRIHTPKVAGAEDVNYGILVEFRKPR